jgi:hypothetical protein
MSRKSMPEKVESFEEDPWTKYSLDSHVIHLIWSVMSQSDNRSTASHAERKCDSKRERLHPLSSNSLFSSCIVLYSRSSLFVTFPSRTDEGMNMKETLVPKFWHTKRIMTFSDRSPCSVLGAG